MSRSGAGTYSLPAGNPVVTNSVISSTWANTTLADIATALTDSLSRSGLGNMTAGLPLFDGTIGLPGLTFGTETTAGLRRASAGNFRFTIGGVDILTFTAAGLTGVGVPTLSGTNAWTGTSTFTKNRAAAGEYGVVITSAGPAFGMIETDAAANNGKWYQLVVAEQLRFAVLNDAESADVAWLTVDRTANVVDQIALTATTVAFGASNLTGSGTGAMSGAWLFSLTGAGGGPAAVTLSSSQPTFDLRETDAAANNQYWRYTAAAEQAMFSIVNDALNTATSWLVVDRTGTTVDRVAFPAEAAGAFYVGTVGGSGISQAQVRTTNAGRYGLTAANAGGGAANGAILAHHENTTGDNNFIEFRTEGGAGTVRGSVTFNRGGTLTAYNVTSDGRLKKNIRNSADAGPIIDQIKVRAFEWKAEGNTLPHWLVAQELALLVPYAVTVPSDPEGNWSIDPSKLVPLLVKAVQELRMRVAAGGL